MRLKPCPFCCEASHCHAVTTAAITDTGRGTWVRCDTCAAYGPYTCGNETLAIEAWNRRSSSGSGKGAGRG